MCEIATIVGLVASAGAAAANASAQSQVANARKDAMLAERIRQQGYDRETDALNATSQNRYQDIGEQQDKKASELGEVFKGATQAPAAIAEQSLMPASQSGIVTQEENNQRAKAQAYTDKQGEALGAFRAFGDMMGGIGREQARDAGYIGQIGGFKRGSANILPTELEAANERGGGARMLGDLLTGVGKLGLSAGIGGGTLGGKAATGANVANALPTFAKGATGGMAGAPLQLGPMGAFPTVSAGGWMSPFKLFG